MTDDEVDLASLDWVSAWTAIEMLHPFYGNDANAKSLAQQALATRAHRGLVKARARLLKSEGVDPNNPHLMLHHEYSDVLLPEHVWRQLGDPYAISNWVSGDFSIKMFGTTKWEAFGVEFDLAGVKEMLPVDRRQYAPPDTSATTNRSLQRATSKKVAGRRLEHDHLYAAAKVALELADLPEAERDRLNGPSVGSLLERHYKDSSPRQNSPHADSLDKFGQRVLQVLQEHWQSKKG